MDSDPLAAQGPSWGVDGHPGTAQGLMNSTSQDQISSLDQEMWARRVKSRCIDCEGINAQGALSWGSLPRGTCSSCRWCTTTKILKETRCLKICYGKGKVGKATVWCVYGVKWGTCQFTGTAHFGMM